MSECASSDFVELELFPLARLLALSGIFDGEKAKPYRSGFLRVRRHCVITCSSPHTITNTNTYYITNHTITNTYFTDMEMLTLT